jgi:hypothetical protein
MSLLGKVVGSVESSIITLRSGCYKAEKILDGCSYGLKLSVYGLYPAGALILLARS